MDAEAVLPPCIEATCIKGYDCMGKRTGEKGVLRTFPSPCVITRDSIVFYEEREKIEYGREDGFCVVYRPIKGVFPIKLCDYIDDVLAGQPRGKIFLGPGGTGKTLALKLISRIAPFNIMIVEAESLLGGLVGESERKLYEVLSQCEASEPCMLVMDEVDILIESRSAKTRAAGTGTAEVTSNLVRILLRRLQEWYDSGYKLALVGASNYPVSLIEKPMLRAGRLGEPIYFPIPDKKALRKLAELFGKELSEDEMEEILRLGLPHSNVVEYFKTGKLEKWEPEAFAGLEYAKPAKKERLGLTEKSRIIIAMPWAQGVKAAALIASTELDKPVLFLKQRDKLLDFYILGENMKMPVAIPYDPYIEHLALEMFYDYPYPVFYIGQHWSEPYLRLDLQDLERLYGPQALYQLYCREKKHVSRTTLQKEIMRCLSGMREI